MWVDQWKFGDLKIKIIEVHKEPEHTTYTICLVFLSPKELLSESKRFRGVSGCYLKMALSRPPYFDPNTGMRYETSCGNTEGWLTKQSEWLKDWRRRYFILKGNNRLDAKNI